MPAQRIRALIDQQRRQTESMERIANSIEVMVNTTMTVALVYPWKNDPSIVRAVLLRNEHDRQRIRLSVHEFATSDRSMSVEEWLRNDGFVVLNSESLFVDTNGICMFMPRAKHTELIPPNEPFPVLRLQRDVEAEERERQACECHGEHEERSADAQVNLAVVEGRRDLPPR